MKQRLSQIAEIRTGLFAKADAIGEVAYLQVKDFDESGSLNSELYPELKLDKHSGKHLLKTGEVLFAAKGQKNFATVYKNEQAPAVASTTFFVLTVKRDDVLPEYLAWALNSPINLNFLKRNAIGSAMVSITKDVLQKMEIRIPSIERQKNILEISRLAKLENELRLKIAELRQIKIQQEIRNALK